MAEENGKVKEVTSEKVISEAEELPKAIVRRVVKDKLSQLSTDSEIQILRDSLLAFSESARIFIHYLSAAANDVCKESKRQIINAEDVFNAMEEIDFSEFVGPLRGALEEFRQKNALKKSASSKTKDANNDAERKTVPSKAKSDSNKKEKRKGRPARGGGKKKRCEDESNESKRDEGREDESNNDEAREDGSSKDEGPEDESNNDEGRDDESSNGEGPEDESNNDEGDDDESNNDVGLEDESNNDVGLEDESNGDEEFEDESNKDEGGMDESNSGEENGN